jgi:hypothetical protein
VYYRIADASVYQLCDLVCGNLARQLDRVATERALFVDSVQRQTPPSRPLRARKRAA